MVSLISTTTPIMFMLSCTIVIKFSQGDYEKAKWDTYNTSQKVFQTFLLSIFGYMIMILVFLIEVARKFLLPFALLAGPDKYLLVESKFRAIQMYMSGLSLYQLN